MEMLSCQIKHRNVNYTLRARRHPHIIKVSGKSKIKLMDTSGAQEILHTLAIPAIGISLTILGDALQFYECEGYGARLL